ncbi:hypothetical protein GQ53DRAFT_743077 [Thozetella sp. PMI_491]|nr:hypothetical protein GQ53DRAFT_743077 [Thozetella sp. PMI_491]
MASFRDRLLHTATDSIRQFGEMTPKSVIAYRHPDCIQRVLPTSAGILTRNNEDYSKYVMELKPLVRNMRYIILNDFEPIVDEITRQVLLHLKSSADTDVGNYENEYFMALKMTDDGTEIVQVVEYLDSAYSAGFISKLGLSK